MGKKKKTIGMFDQQDVVGDIFTDAAALDRYLDQFVPSNINDTNNDQEEEFDDSEDAGAAIAEMLASTIAEKSHPQQLSPVKAAHSVRPQPMYDVTRPDVKPSIQNNGSNIPKTKVERSNIVNIRDIHGIKHLVIRDFAGTAVSVPFNSGEYEIDDNYIDILLRDLYMIRKLTGIPAAIYDYDEFDKRMLRRNIFNMDANKFIICRDDNLAIVLGFVIDEDEFTTFKNFILANVPRESLADTVILTVSTLFSRSIFGPYSNDENMYELYTVLYSNNDNMKDSFEERILSDPETITEGCKLEFDVDDYEKLCETVYRHVGSIVKSLAGDGTLEEQNESYEDTDGSSYPSFDPEVSQYGTVETGKESGAPNDKEPFPDKDNADERIGTEQHVDTGASSGCDLSASMSGNCGDVLSSTPDSSGERREEGVSDPGRDRAASELSEEKEEKETPEEVGHRDTTREVPQEVDPENFTFEDEEEETPQESQNGMVIGVTTIGK